MLQSNLPLISVTLAAYNVENYIEASIDSILAQSLRDFELICIDDGSTDNTKNILQKYEKLDPRVKVVVNPENKGLAVARNESLKLARAEYIMFVDGDDLMSPDLLEKTYKEAKTRNSSMVIWDYVTFNDGEEEQITNKKHTSSLKIDLSKEYLLERPAFTWLKLIKTDVLRTLGIYFPPGLTRQDIPVHWHLVTALDDISIIPEVLSFYRQRASATTHRSDERLFDLSRVMNITKEYLIKHSLYDRYKFTFLKHQINFLFGMYDKADKTIENKALKIINSELNEEHWAYIKSTSPLRWQARHYFLSKNGHIPSSIKYLCWKHLRAVYRAFKKS